jgi:hypothetical protein
VNALWKVVSDPTTYIHSTPPEIIAKEAAGVDTPHRRTTDGIELVDVAGLQLMSQTPRAEADVDEMRWPVGRGTLRMGGSWVESAWLLTARASTLTICRHFYVPLS